VGEPAFQLNYNLFVVSAGVPVKRCFSCVSLSTCRLNCILWKRYTLNATTDKWLISVYFKLDSQRNQVTLYNRTDRKQLLLLFTTPLPLVILTHSMLPLFHNIKSLSPLSFRPHCPFARTLFRPTVWSARRPMSSSVFLDWLLHSPWFNIKLFGIYETYHYRAPRRRAK
jgi:hypothetical protein